jgi:hemerythrin-like metal-binding protein
MLILWRESMSIDGGVIDQDHQTLISIINEFAGLPPVAGSAEALRGTLVKLDAYAKGHFAREEALQRSIDYPHRDGHHQEHARLISELGRLSEQLAEVREGELGEVQGHMATFLHHWLIDHVVKSDLHMKPFAAQLVSVSNTMVLPHLSNLQGLSILIVEDELFMRSTIMAVLRAIDRSFVVTAAGDGETALRLIDEHRPELILCDVNMAPMTGLQVVEHLRNHADHALRDIAVIMLTGHVDEVTIQRAMSLNIKGYMVKPVSSKQLEVRLHTIFQDRHQDTILAQAGVG